MKNLLASLFMFAVFFAETGLAQEPAQQTTAGVAADEASTAPLPAPDPTAAQQRIAAATQQLKTDPGKAQASNELANAYLRRARETSDPSYLNNADEALAKALKSDPENFQLLRTKAALLLSRHQFVQARDLATALHHRTPDDVLTYGELAEAQIALGDYQDAEKNAQWMMNLRPNNTPALMVGASLRVLFSDPHGALQFLNRAYSQTSPAEVEDLTWIANQIASIQIDLGENDAAAQTLDRAEQLFPGAPYTVENLARLRTAQSRPADAVELWKQAAQHDKDPRTLYELAKAQAAAGQATESQATYAQFEKLATTAAGATDVARLDLIQMYAATPATAPQALKLAQFEIQQRQDVHTLDAFAWALYANAQFQEADAAIQKAISVGIQNAQILDHAARIAEKLNRPADAARYSALARQANPYSQNATQPGNSANAAQLANPADPITSSASKSDSANPISPSPSIRASAVFEPVPDALLTPHTTTTENQIRAAQAAATRAPKDAAAFAGLGAAYFQRARETGDVSDYQLAEQSLLKSLDLASEDFSSEAALETLAEVCMGEHRFTDALTYAQKALSLGTGELSPFAIIGDAYADMGSYDKAALAYSRLTPRDTTLSPRASYARDSRVSYLRFIAGDTPAAIALMKTAVAEGVEAQLPAENLAWLYYELGEYESQAGDAASANAAYLAALNTHPGDFRALAAMGKLRANAGRYQEAIQLYQKAIAIVPMPIFVAELGDLYAKSGNQPEAQKQFSLVEYIGLLGHINQVLHNRDLAIFYADHDLKLPESLDLAQKELEVRRDVYTWDALAFALYKNGKLPEAAEASQKALKLGTRDSLLLFHAALIAQGLGQNEQARNDLKLALQINPHFHPIYAQTAEQKLSELEAKSAEGTNQHAR